jgi:hypothetical protein
MLRLPGIAEEDGLKLVPLSEGGLSMAFCQTRYELVWNSGHQFSNSKNVLLKLATELKREGFAVQGIYDYKYQTWL